MRTPIPEFNNIDWEKVELKHIYTVLGIAWIVIGFVAIGLLINS